MTQVGAERRRTQVAPGRKMTQVGEGRKMTQVALERNPPAPLQKWCLHAWTCGSISSHRSVVCCVVCTLVHFFSGGPAAVGVALRIMSSSIHVFPVGLAR